MQASGGGNEGRSGLRRRHLPLRVLLSAVVLAALAARGAQRLYGPLALERWGVRPASAAEAGLDLMHLGADLGHGSARALAVGVQDQQAGAHEVWTDHDHLSASEARFALRRLERIGAGQLAPLIVTGLLLTFLVPGALVGAALGGRRLRRRSLCGAVLALLGAVGMTVLLYTLASVGPGPLQRLTLKRFLEVSFVLGGGLGSAFWGGWVSGGWLAPRSGLVAAGTAALFEPLWFLFTLVLLGSGVSLYAPRASLLPTAMLAGATVVALWAAPVGRWLAPCHRTGRAGRPQG